MLANLVIVNITFELSPRSTFLFKKNNTKIQIKFFLFFRFLLRVQQHPNKHLFFRVLYFQMEEYATVKRCISHEETLASKKSIIFFTNPSSCWYFIIVVGFLFSVTAFAMATYSVVKDNSSDIHYSAKVDRQQQKSSVCNVIVFYYLYSVYISNFFSLTCFGP